MALTPSSQDFDYAATDEDGVFQECAQRLKLVIDAEALNRQQAIQDLEFADGLQWPDDLYNFRKLTKRPSLTINHTEMFLDRIENNMRQQRPRIKVHPISEAEVEDAKVIAGVIRHIEYRSQASVAYDVAGRYAVRSGWGFARIIPEYPDPRAWEQELRIVPIFNPFSVYMDPSSEMPDGSDSKWVIISEKMKRIDFRRRYPAEFDEFKTFGPGDAIIADWQTQEEIRLAEYFRIYEREETLYQLVNGKGIWKDEWREMEPMLLQAGITLNMRNGKPVSRKSHRRYVEWYLITGTKVIDRRSVRSGSPFPGRWIPVIRCEGKRVNLNGEVRRKGATRNMRDPARMYNYWQTALTEKLALAPKAPWVMAEGQTEGHPEWEDANQLPYSRLEYKVVTGPDGQTPLPPPQRQPAVEVEQGLIAAAQLAEHDLLAIAGMPHEPGQDAPGLIVSGKALRARQALSDISHFQYYDNQTLMIAQIGRICCNLIPFYYSGRKILRIIGEDGIPQMMEVNKPIMTPTMMAIAEIKNDLTVGEYDVVMDTGPGYETKRLENAEAMIDLMRTPLGNICANQAPDIILRNFDFPGADDLADRMTASIPEALQKALAQMPAQQRAIITAMQTQLQQAQQTIQQQAMQLKSRMDVEQLKAQVEKYDIDSRDATKRQDSMIRAQSANQVARTAANQKILDTTLNHIEEFREGVLDRAHEAKENALDRLEHVVDRIEDRRDGQGNN